MSFTPRTHANGGLCCTNERYLCAACEKHFAALGGERHSELNSAFDADPYAQPLAALRAVTHKQVVPLTAEERELFGDGYANGIERLRSAQR